MAKAPWLFRYFPDLQRAIPWIDLGTRVAPVQRIAGLGFENLWIKRTDRISTVYGGNKVSRLEFLLGQALAQGKKEVVTLGGIGSNHCLATAIYCQRVGLPCSLVLFDQPLTPFVRENLLLMHRHQAKMAYFPSILRAAADFYLVRRRMHAGACFIPSGGASPLGILGAVSDALELKAQIDRKDVPPPRFVIYPTASNGGLAGLNLGFALAGLKTTVIGVRCGAARLHGLPLNTPGTVRRAMARTYAFLKGCCPSIPRLRLPDPVVLDGYCGDGYGWPTPAGTRATRLFAEKAGVGLEPVYTAKTCAALLDILRNRAAFGDPILYWHTYNGVDLSREAAAVVPGRLPRPFHRFFGRNRPKNGAAGPRSINLHQT